MRKIKKLTKAWSALVSLAQLWTLILLSVSRPATDGARVTLLSLGRQAMDGAKVTLLSVSRPATDERRA